MLCGYCFVCALVLDVFSKETSLKNCFANSFETKMELFRSGPIIALKLHFLVRNRSIRFCVSQTPSGTQSNTYPITLPSIFQSLPYLRYDSMSSAHSPFISAAARPTSNQLPLSDLSRRFDSLRGRSTLCISGSLEI